MKTLILASFLLPLLSGAGIIQAQDWPDLNHFEKDNDALEPPHPDEKRVVFMGNSITIGWLNGMPEFFEGKPYINRGISGQTTPQMLLRFRRDVIALKPRVVLILAGTNDIAGNTGPATLDMIMDNIKSMAELARVHHIAVVLCSVLPASDYPWRTGLGPDEKIPALNTAIKNYAMENDLVYLDYFSALANNRNGMDPELAADGVHPTRKGYQIMAPMAEAAIEKALNSR